MPTAARRIGDVAVKTVRSFMADGCPRMAAALSYYTIFSLAPLLVLVVLVTGMFVTPETVEGLLHGEVGSLLGPEGAAQVQTMIENVQPLNQGSPIASVLGTAAFVLGATAAFTQLQAALNATWKVEPDPTLGDVRTFLLKRVLSFTMILGIGFLLLVLLVVSALLAAFTDALTRIAPAGLSGPLLQAINSGVSLAVIALLFAVMFKAMPDAKVEWRDAAVGAVVTALLFVAGKFLIGLHLGRSDPGSVFGAAGSLAVVLVWIYYTSMILLLGAEFTAAWADSRGAPIEPSPGAVRVVWVKHRSEPRPRGERRLRLRRRREPDSDPPEATGELPPG